jgi:hypothetical protein
LSDVADLSKAVARGFDAQRRVLGPKGHLVLSQYDMETGESALATIISGWLPTQTSDFLKVEIVENATLDNGETLTDGQVYTAHRLRLNNKVYNILPLEQQGVVPPVGQPRLWIIKATELRPRL